MKRFARRWPLWAAPLLALAFFLILSRVTYFRYENSDDFLIVRAFLGFEGVSPSLPHFHLHPLLVWALSLLSAAVPGVAWFSVLQLALLWLSAATLCLSLLCCGRAARLHPAACLAAAALFLGVFSSFVCTRLTYTTTSAMLGAAATALLVCAGVTRRHVGAAVLFSAALVILSGILRIASLPASLCFWLLGLVFLFLRLSPQSDRRSLLRALLPAAIAGVLLVGVRVWEKQTYRPFFDFHEARVELMDYHPEALENVSPEVLATLGWDASEAELVQQWYFMDENITADALRLIRESGQATPSLPERIAAAGDALISFFRDNPAYLLSLLLAAMLTALVSFVCRGLPRWMALAALGLYCAMVLYLAWGGRLLSRGVDCALLPAAGMLACLALAGFPAGERRGVRAAALCLCALVLIPAGLHLLQTHHTLTRRADAVSPAREADLEAYALENPDRLMIRTPDLLRDTRLFPDVSAGIPGNTMIWGDWACRTSGWNAQLARFGLDPGHFTAADFCDEAILFVTADDAPPEALLRYISHGAGRAVTAVLEGTRGELNFFAFR